MIEPVIKLGKWRNRQRWRRNTQFEEDYQPSPVFEKSMFPLTSSKFVRASIRKNFSLILDRLRKRVLCRRRCHDADGACRQFNRLPVNSRGHFEVLTNGFTFAKKKKKIDSTATHGNESLEGTRRGRCNFSSHNRCASSLTERCTAAALLLPSRLMQKLPRFVLF